MPPLLFFVPPFLIIFRTPSGRKKGICREDNLGKLLTWKQDMKYTYSHKLQPVRNECQNAISLINILDFLQEELSHLFPSYTGYCKRINWNGALRLWREVCFYANQGKIWYTLKKKLSLLPYGTPKIILLFIWAQVVQIQGCYCITQWKTKLCQENIEDIKYIYSYWWLLFYACQ